MRPKTRIPATVLERARAAAKPVAPRATKAPKPPRAPKAKIVSALKRLHPMD